MSDLPFELDLVQVGGFSLRRDDEHFVALGAALGEYQQRVRTAAYRYVRVWSQAIDVGGHIGIFSRDFAKHFVHVHAFEPMPFNRRCLESNVSANTTIHAVGLGDRPGTAVMRYSWRNSGGSEVIDPNEIREGQPELTQVGIKQIPVEIRTLDSFGFRDVGLIKVDVQGMEEHVLRGAADTLRASMPVVILEEKTVKSRPQDTRAIEAAAAVILSYGYRKAEMVGQDAIYVPAAA